MLRATNFVALYLVALSTCGPKPPQSPQPPAVRCWSVTIRAADTNGGLVGARVALNDLQGTTDASARVRLCPVSVDTHRGELGVSMDGYQDRFEIIDIDQGDPTPPFGDVEWADIYLNREVALPRITINGRFFALESGEPFTIIEASDFNILGRFLDGQDIRPTLKQRFDAGFNTLRVWTRYDLAQYGIGRLTFADHPELYERIPEFLNLCAEYGLYVEFTAYTGHEDFDTTHWARLIEAVKTRSNVLLELVNEADQKGNMIGCRSYAPNTSYDGCQTVQSMGFAQPTGLLTSHGSNGTQAQPVAPFWSYVTMHFTSPISEPARKVGHNCWESVDDRPCLANENIRFPDVYDSIQVAKDAAAGAALLAGGSAFHSVHGKSSEPWDGQELVLATAWAQAAQAVPLYCQGGAYRRRDDLLGPGINRVYQRGNLNACIVVIHEE